MKLFTIVRLIQRFLAVLVASALLPGCGAGNSNATSAAPVSANSPGSVTTVSALTLSLNTQYSNRSFYTGRVESARLSDLGFELGGLLKSVAVDEGDRVTQGDVLARLDGDRLKALIRESEAGVAQSRAQSGLAQSTLNRLVEAREFDGVSQQQFDEASNAAATSRAAVLAAESRLARVRVDLSKTRLIAPYDAVVLRRHHDEGQVLSPGQAVLSIQDTDRLQVRVGVAGAVTGQLEVGKLYTLIVNDRPVSARLRSVLPVRDAVSRTVDVFFVLESDAAKDRVGVTAGDLAQLELRRTVDAQGFWVPLTALAEGERGLWNAYVLVRDNEASGGESRVVQSRAVEVLYQDGSRAFISGALQPDEQIIPSGLNRVVPGQRVAIVREGY